MPALRTEISEITTGLAMLGFPDVDRALEVRPRFVHNVEAEHYERLREARRSGEHDRLFAAAWANGVEFARSSDGLRGRPPWWLEWKGNHRPPGYEQIPADLRVDHVYLISCKYGSNILTNSSPANLFDRLLGDRREEVAEWYLEVAPHAYQRFYAMCRDMVGDGSLPERIADLTPEAREVLKRLLPRRFSGRARDLYREFAHEVATASARRWRRAMPDRRSQEAMLWRLLRLESSPYFVLGEAADRSLLRYRVGTPWDFRNAFRFVEFEVWADLHRDQPVVRWIARVEGASGDGAGEVEGHVEVRWSHGRFAQAPEAKVYLDSPHHDVPGYFPVDAPPPSRGQLTLGLDA